MLQLRRSSVNSQHSMTSMISTNSAYSTYSTRSIRSTRACLEGTRIRSRVKGPISDSSPGQTAASPKQPLELHTERDECAENVDNDASSQCEYLDMDSNDSSDSSLPGASRNEVWVSEPEQALSSSSTQGWQVPIGRDSAGPEVGQIPLSPASDPTKEVRRASAESTRPAQATTADSEVPNVQAYKPSRELTKTQKFLNRVQSSKNSILET